MGKRSAADLKAQREGKERDGCCQVCGSEDHLEAHHILDCQYDGADDVDNIITLCHEHHRMVHEGKIDLIKF